MKWHLQIVRDIWVIWGYGPRRTDGGVTHIGRAEISLGDLGTISFELPERVHDLPAPQEYERRDGYAWRWELNDRGAGHSFRLAESIEDAIAKASATLTHMRADTRRHLEHALSDVRITDERLAKPASEAP